MFIKIVIVLLLLIVAASLLVQRSGGAPRQRAATRLRPLMMRVAIVLLVVVALFATLHLAGCARPGESFRGLDVTGAPWGRLDTLDGFTDHTGRRFASAELQGKAVMLFFGYTQCPDICPTTLVTMKEAMRLLGSEADRVQVLFVSVDPDRDTQDILAAYVPWFDARFVGLRSEAEATRTAAAAFRVFYAKAKGSDALNYSIDHTANSLAYDPQGRLRLSFVHGASAVDISTDLGKLLAGK